MRCLARAPNLAIAALWADALRAAGLDATVQRQFLSGAAGELPPDQCLPEVRIVDEAQLARAEALLAHLADLPQRRWRCTGCGEEVEGGFEACWNCGQPAPPD